MTSDFIFRWIIGGILAALIGATIWVGTILPWDNILDMFIALVIAVGVVGMPWLAGDLIVFKWQDRQRPRPAMGEHEDWCVRKTEAHMVCYPPGT